ncbi:hypothetical protein QUB63_34965 [Microcoleus sp. ARI1-B5]
MYQQTAVIPARLVGKNRSTSPPSDSHTITTNSSMAAPSTYAIAQRTLFAEADELSNSDGFVLSVSFKNPRMKLSIKLLQKLNQGKTMETVETMEKQKTSQKHIDLFLKPKDCFFLYNPSHWCPGWAIGQIELPIPTSYSRFLTLVRDAEGGCHWVSANKVAIRGQTHLFETYAASSFDWAKINTFKPIVW